MSEKEKFESVFPTIVNDLKEILVGFNMPNEAIEWYCESLNINCIGGKANRGIAVIDSFKILTGKKELNENEYKQAALLGWFIELLQAFFLVADDIMDESTTRRGKLCWYKNDKVGLIAINDSFMLESAIYQLLKKYFRNHKNYIELFELFQDVTFKTELGQLLDLITAPQDVVNLSNFSLEKHEFIITFKTAYYSFYLPVALAMYLSGINDERDFKQAQDVLIQIGQYFQIQDDYLDCYGDASVIGKIGTDIQDNKCSWIVNRALLKANSKQRELLDNNYGKRDDAKAEKIVKQVFNELNLKQDYLDYQESIVDEIQRKIDNIDESRGFKRQVLTTFLDKIYNRSK